MGHPKEQPNHCGGHGKKHSIRNLGGGGLRKDLSEKQDQACDKLSQRLKENEKYQFKRKGNELQHAFNEEEKEVLCLTDRHDTIMPIQASFVFAPTLNCSCQ